MSPSSSPDLLDAESPLPAAPSRASGRARERVVAHALAGDVARLHGEALLRTALRYSQSADDAHDAYQRAMERLLEHAGTIDRSKAVAWMHVVVRREAGLVRRNHGPTTVPLEADDVDVAMHRLARLPDEHVHAIDLAQRASEALATLKEAEAQALCLRAQGLSYDEIADVYGWSYSKVNRAVTEGRKAFVDHYTAVESGAVCSATASQLGKYVEGTLKPRAVIKVRAHLVRCSGCRALLHAQRDADTALRALLPTVLVAAASDRTTRLTGWLHDHLLGPIGHAAGRLQPAADHLIGGKVGLVAASTVALAGSGMAAQHELARSAPPPALKAGLTDAPSKTPTAPALSPGALVGVVDHAVDNGKASAARVQQRAAAKIRTQKRAARRKQAAKARRLANAREFASGVSEFDTTTQASAERSAAAASATSSSGSTGSPSTATSGSAPVTEVPVGDATADSSVDVVTEQAPAGDTGSGAFGD